MQPVQPALSSVDRDPVVEAYKAGIDRTLLRRNLRLSVEERIEQLQEMARFREELRRAGKALRSGK
jgi:hypothetical protein